MIPKLPIDILWVLLSAGFVFMMQAGFLCLESGLTRAKNSINVAIKNLTDFGIAVLLYWMFGFAVMFGSSQWGWFGSTYFCVRFYEGGAWFAAFFLFEVMCCATAATLVTGAVAERTKFHSYILITMIIAGLVYPLFGHWAWGGFYDGVPGWLAAAGFVDFAGSTVVHSTGGWVALAAMLVIGPRMGRFTESGQTRQIMGSNLSMSILGVLILLFGWMGINGGSMFLFNQYVPGVIANTVLAAVAGMIFAMMASWFLHRRVEVTSPMYGLIAGLVSISGCCFAVHTSSAVLIGGMGGLISIAMASLLERLKIDDAVGAVPVHLGPGIWGTLAVAIFGDPVLLRTGLGRIEQMLIQLVGVVACFVLAFGVTYLLLSIINRFFPLRVSPEEEEAGLNVSEHGAVSEMYDLLRIMENQAKTQDLSLRVPEEPFTEVGQIAKQYNRVMMSLESLTNKLKESQSKLIQADKMAAVGTMSAGIAHELNNPIMGLLNFIQYCLRHTEKVDPRYPVLLDAERETKRCSSIVQNLLTFSHSEKHGKEIYTYEDIVDIIQRGLKLLGFRIRDEEVNVNVHVDNRVPRVWVRANNIEQVFLNLIGNALDELQNVTEKELQVDVRTLNAFVQISISDTGRGIDSKKMRRVFEPFFTTKPTGAGTGLGLSVCLNIVKEHGGEITVDSKLGAGTTFRVLLPTDRRRRKDGEWTDED